MWELLEQVQEQNQALLQDNQRLRAVATLSPCVNLLQVLCFLACSKAISERFLKSPSPQPVMHQDCEAYHTLNVTQLLSCWHVQPGTCASRIFLSFFASHGEGPVHLGLGACLFPTCFMHQQGKAGSG